MNTSPAETAPEGAPGSLLRWVALSAVIATFLLIVMGGIVRATGSGLGCPDWPLCYGQIIPPLQYDAIIEYTHRLAAAIASPLIALTTFIAILRYRSEAWILWPSLLASALLIVQILLGAVTVFMELPPTTVAVHLGNALIILALILVVTVRAFWISRTWPDAPQVSLESGLTRQTGFMMVMVLILLVSGAYVTSSGATAACPSWPICESSLLPDSNLQTIHMAHRALAGLIALGLVWIWWRISRRRYEVPNGFIASSVVLVFLFLQILIGGLGVLFAFPTVIRALHIATASAVWGAAVVTAAAISHELPGKQREGAAANSYAAISFISLFLLTKPIIVGLLLITTLAAMIIAAGGWPGWTLVFWTLLGGGLAAGGASTLNQYIDRVADRQMQRTSLRPLPSGKVDPAVVIAWGLALSILSFYVLTIFVNLLSAMLALAGILYYVIFYSLFLKERTTHNIVIGGGAGAIPPLVGWAAVTGEISMAAFFLFALIFFWTPPHFWALALVRKQDYERAGVPMLPVVEGDVQTRRLIGLYSIQLVALTLLLPLVRVGGWLYFILAVGLGVGLVYYAIRVWRQGGNRNAWGLYRYSSMYLALIFGAMVLDTFV